jgi:hypothetical protein
MVVWGLGQELLVEYLFNGRVWIYEPLALESDNYSPHTGFVNGCGVYVNSTGRVGGAPIVFYLICIKTKIMWINIVQIRKCYD